MSADVPVPAAAGAPAARVPLLGADADPATGRFNLHRVLEHHPALQAAWGPFARHVLADQTLPVRDRELAMLRIGWRNGAVYEWHQHVRLARRAGITAAEIAAVAGGDRSPFAAYEAAVLDAVDDLVDAHAIADATWSRLCEHYDAAQLLDLVFTIGQYNLVSWFLNAFGVPLETTPT